MKTVASAATLIAVGQKLGGGEGVSFETVASTLEGVMTGGEAVEGFRERDRKIFAQALNAAAKKLEALYAESLRRSHSPGFEDGVRVAFANLAEVIARCLPGGEDLARLEHDPDRIAAAVVEKALAIRMEIFADPHGEARKILVTLVSGAYRALRGEPSFMAALEGANWGEALARLGRIEAKGDRHETEAERRNREAEQAADRRQREIIAANEAANENLRLEIAREKGVPADVLRPLFEHLGMLGLTVFQMREEAEKAIAAILAKATERVAPSNLGGDIDAIIGAARAKLAAIDTAGAESILDDHIAEEEANFRRRQVPLLAEKAAVQRLTYNHEGAKRTLRRLLAIDPDSVWACGALGDLWLTTGSLGEALRYYQLAAAVAERTGDDRDLSVSRIKIGDVLVRQGNLPEALASYRAGMAIAERLAGTDAGNSEWRRDLSVSRNKIGDVLVRQGNLPEALASYRAGMAIRERLAGTDAGNADWQRDLIVSCVKIAEASPDDAQDMLTRAGAIANRLWDEGRLAPADAWMPAALAEGLAALPGQG